MSNATARRRRALVLGAALGLSATLGLSSCAQAEAPSPQAPSEPSTVTVTDNNGMQTIRVPPRSVVALDNRTFETLSAWGVELSAGARSLMPDTIPYAQVRHSTGWDSVIPDVGTTDDPDFEVIAEAEPDLVVNGEWFTPFHDEIVERVPDAVVLELEPRELEPFDDELRRQTIVLGEIFQKRDEAAELVAAFDEAISRVEKAYDPDDTVLIVAVSEGEIGYAAPGSGPTFGQLFDFLHLSPALEVPSPDEALQEEERVTEAQLAASDPDWVLIMDRDAALGANTPAYIPAQEVLEASEDFADITAVQREQTVFMPDDAYANAGIQTYTEIMNDFADALDAENEPSSP